MLRNPEKQSLRNESSLYVPQRVSDLATWITIYLQAAEPGMKERLSVVLGAATVLLRTDLETGLMLPPTDAEKELARYLLEQSQKRGYRRDETVAALIGAADGIALASVRRR